jgi:multicomponent Na+:H+ antiporter subunit D
LPAAGRSLQALSSGTREALAAGAGRTATTLLAAVGRQAGPDSRLARTWGTRSMALWVLVVLLGYLLLYYV